MSEFFITLSPFKIKFWKDLIINVTEDDELDYSFGFIKILL